VLMERPERRDHRVRQAGVALPELLDLLDLSALVEQVEIPDLRGQLVHLERLVHRVRQGLRVLQDPRVQRVLSGF